MNILYTRISLTFTLLLAFVLSSEFALAQRKVDLSKLHNYQLFNQIKASQDLKNAIDTACRTYSVAETNNAFWTALISEKPSSLEFKIPTSNGELLAQVSAVEVLSSDFVLQEWANGITTTRNFEAGLYFRGKLKNDPSSTVAISFFENGQIIGVVFSKNWSGNLVIGRTKSITNAPFNERPILIYNDNQLQRKNGFRCATPDSPLPEMAIPQTNSEAPQGLTPITCKVVRMYLEAGTTVYTASGSSITATTNYVTGLMNVISAVYDSEQLAVVISRLQVNSTDDAVPLTSSTTVLNSFSTRMGTTTAFTEPIAHYLTANRGLGGLAYVGSLCFSRVSRTGMSDIDDTYSLLPTYSWSVNVMSHELGHNLGSNHTQWCGWQITPTIRRQIDSCYTSEAATGGTCYTGPDVGRVGTIMSYCHLSGSVDLALGFGTLPGAAIRNGVSGSGCISNGNITTPTVTASGSTTICNGDSVTLTATGGIRYIWSNGATTASIVVKTGGTYKVNALLGTCRSAESTSIIVTVVSAPSTPTISTNRSTNLCSGESIVLTSSLTSANQWFKDGNLITGATSRTFTANSSGNYQVRQGPNTNNCFSISTPIAVNVSFIERTNTATSSVNNVCSGTTVQLRSNRTIGAQVFRNNNTSVSISNAGTPTVQSVINIPDNYTLTTQDTLIVGLDVNHTFLADLTISLISPLGIRVVLFNRQGGSSDNLFGTQFSNFRGIPLGTGVAPFTGLYAPSGSFTSFANQSISGNWTLEVADGANDDGGELLNWSFQLKSRSLFAGFRWSVLNGALLDSAATMNVTPNTTTSYVLTKTSFNGCTDKDTIAVTITNLTSPTVTLGGSTTFCTGGSVVLTSSAISGNLWSNGSTTRSITVTTAGSYTVRQITGTCTSATSTPVVVTVNPLPNVNIVVEGSTSFCSASGVGLRANPSNGTTFSYQWFRNSIATTGADAINYTATQSGTYTVRVINENACTTLSGAVSLTGIITPTPPTISGLSIFCIGSNTVLTSSATTGNLWSNGATTRSITVSNAGSYTVRAISGTCTSDNSNEIVVSSISSPATPTISGSASFCSGGNTVLTSSTATGNLWSNGATSQSITVTNAGSYTVRVILGTCSSAVSGIFNVTETAVLTPPTITGNSSYCQGETTTLTSSAITGNLWSNGATSRSITVNNPATYSVRVISGSCTSNVSNLVTVTETALPTSPIITGNTSYCEGETTVLTSSATTGNLWSNGATSRTITVSNPGIYTNRVIIGTCTSAVSNVVTVTERPLPTPPVISGNNSYCQGGTTVLTSSASTGNVWSNGATTQSITVSNPAIYSVRVIIGTCTSVLSNLVTVIETPLPTAPIITGNTSYCQGETTVLTSSATTGNVWSNGATTQSITVNNPATYSVRVIVGTCSSVVSNLVTVTETPLPTAPIITGNTSYCQGETTVLTSSATTGNVWSNGATTQSITVSNPATYSVRVIVGTCTSSVSNLVTVTETPLPTAPIITGNTSYCQGEATVLTSSAITGNIWSNGATSQTITVSNPATYSVRVIVGTCTSSVSNLVAVTETPSPSTPIVTGNTSYCQGEATVLTSSATTGNLWSNGATSQTITVSNPATYSVRVIVGTCSSAVSNLVSVTETPLPTSPIITGNTSYCQGEATVLTSSATTGNIWSNGATTQTITVSNPGIYTVRFIVGTCTSAVSNLVTVIETPLPSTPIVTGNTGYCQGGTTILTSSSNTGNIWSNGATTQTITVSNPATYSVRVIVGNCTSAVSNLVTVSEINLARPQVSANTTNLIAGDSAILTVNNPNIGSEYIWNNGIIATRIVVRNSDTLTVQERLLGCISEASLPIFITNNKTSIDKSLDVQVYPNPAFGSVNISIAEPVEIRFYSMEGKIVKQLSLEQSGIVDLKALTSGLYQVIISNQKGQHTTKLMVK